MLRRRSDLPLDKDPASRFLPWLIAFMVFLAILAMSGVTVLHRMSDKWDAGVSGTLTVQIPPAEILKGAPSDPDRLARQNTRRLDAVIKVLRETPAVQHAEVIPDARVARLLEPWLGEGAQVADLPLPRLVDVRLREGATINEAALLTRLKAAAQGTQMDSHKVWLDKLLSLLRSIQGLAIAVLTFIVAATVGTVIFTTRTSLAIHQDVIEVLHLTGAQDTYIARQFGAQALRLGLKGGLLGLGLAAPTLWAVGYFSDGGGLLPPLQLGVSGVVVVVLVPFLVALLAMWTARRTVLKALARMP